MRQNWNGRCFRQVGEHSGFQELDCSEVCSTGCPRSEPVEHHGSSWLVMRLLSTEFQAQTKNTSLKHWFGRVSLFQALDSGLIIATFLGIILVVIRYQTFLCKNVSVSSMFTKSFSGPSLVALPLSADIVHYSSEGQNVCSMVVWPVCLPVSTGDCQM